jgi:hypothetical protein
MRTYATVMALAIFEVLALSCNVHPQKANVTDAVSSRIPVGTSPTSVLIADLNADSRLDLLVANARSKNVSVLLGDGRGGFTQAAGSPFAAGDEPADIAVGEINGDGHLDLVIPNHGTKYVTVLFGDGRGGFAPAPHSPFTIKSDPHPHGAALADFNGDRKLDIVVDDWQNDKVTVMFSDGHDGFVPPGSSFAVGKMPYHKVRAADVNGDGKPDIITTNMRGNNATLLLGDGRGGFTEAAGSPFATSDSPFFLAIGDMNRDGRPDMAIASYSGQGSDPSDDRITILLGDGRGGFRQMSGSPFPTTGRASGSLAIGDINGDGIADVAVANGVSNDVTVLLGSKQGTLTPGSTLAVGHSPFGIAVGDLNGDGKADIVTSNNGDNDITVLLSK